VIVSATAHTPAGFAPAAAGPKNGLGIAALVCGIIGVLVGLIPLMFLGAGALAILGIVFGIIGIRRAKRGEATNRGMAITGLVTGVIAACLAIYGVVVVVSATDKLSSDLSKVGTETANAATRSATNADPVSQATVDQQEHKLIQQGEFIGNQ
jgi:membrane-bound ClpP family serine protease